LYTSSPPHFLSSSFVMPLLIILRKVYQKVVLLRGGVIWYDTPHEREIGGAERTARGMRQRTVILAAGTFPRQGTVARQMLDGAARVVCCDGAADAYRRKTGREPTVVVGDCDSVKGAFAHVVQVAEQETNDLEKAVRLCAAKAWRNPVVLGATGRREDHAIGNLFRCMEHGLEVVTDEGRFVPIVGRKAFAVGAGAAVSIFARPGTRMTSTGLEWPLDTVAFENFYCATLNRAKAARIVLASDRPAYAYLVLPRVARRAADGEDGR